jgi:hypothetical protein
MSDKTEAKPARSPLADELLDIMRGCLIHEDAAGVIDQRRGWHRDAAINAKLADYYERRLYE